MLVRIWMLIEYVKLITMFDIHKTKCCDFKSQFSKELTNGTYDFLY